MSRDTRKAIFLETLLDKKYSCTRQNGQKTKPIAVIFGLNQHWQHLHMFTVLFEYYIVWFIWDYFNKIVCRGRLNSFHYCYENTSWSS